MDPSLVRTSKWMSRVLRHAPESVGLTLDANGWVPVTELLAALSRHGRAVTRDELDAVVAGNDKQRFGMRTGPDGVTWIRASQGHSARVTVDLALIPVTPPELLYHGTATVNVPAILAQGLRPGRRHHVHLSVDVATAVTVGQRRGGPVLGAGGRRGEAGRAGARVLSQRQRGVAHRDGPAGGHPPAVAVTAGTVGQSGRGTAPPGEVRRGCRLWGRPPGKWLRLASWRPGGRRSAGP